MIKDKSNKCFGCKRCINCTKCINCRDCNECNWCDDCKGCNNCLRCINCTDCINCKDCEDCTLCNDCNNCLQCFRCINCEHCFSCKDCNGLYNTRYCINNVRFDKKQFEHILKEATLHQRIALALSKTIMPAGSILEASLMEILQAIEDDDGTIAKIIEGKERKCTYHGFCLTFKLNNEYFFMRVLGFAEAMKTTKENEGLNGYITRITEERQMTQSLDCIKDEEDKKKAVHENGIYND